jgi:hypothetical protein
MEEDQNSCGETRDRKFRNGMDRSMPDYDRAAMGSFVAELNRVWMMAGPPSYGDFEKLSAKVKGPAGPRVYVLSDSTTQEILTGHRRRPPKWYWVARFLTVLRVAAAEVGVDPDSLGTLAEWKKKHEAACAAVAATPQLAGVPRSGLGLVLNEDDADRDGVLASARRAVGREWWCDYRDLMPGWLGAYLSLEPAASLVRTYDTALVPELLQTEEYAEAAIRMTGHARSAMLVRRLVELRMRRQELLNQRGAPRIWVIVDETALRRRVGSAITMRTQVKHLISISDQPNITMQIMPLDTRVHAVAGGPITLLRFPRSDLPDIAYLEQVTGALYLHRQRDVSHYRQLFDRLGIEALTPTVTACFLSEILGGRPDTKIAFAGSPLVSP